MTQFNSKLVMVDTAGDQMRLEAFLETISGQQAGFNVLSLSALFLSRK